jgi:hypothetical protein
MVKWVAKSCYFALITQFKNFNYNYLYFTCGGVIRYLECEPYHEKSSQQTDKTLSASDFLSDIKLKYERRLKKTTYL